MKSASSSSWLGKYLAVGTIWGGSFFFIALGNQMLTVFGVAFWRMALGAIPMAALMMLAGHRLPREPHIWVKVGITSLCMNSVPSVLFAVAEHNVSSAFAGIINAATPVFTLVMILLIFREEKPKPVVLLGLGIGLVGVLTVLEIWNGFGANDPLAVLTLLLAVGLYGIGGPFARRYVTPLKLEPKVQVTMQVGLAAAMLAPFYLSGPIFTATPSWPAVTAMLVLGVLGTGYAYIWYYQIMATAGSAIANSVTYLSPVVAVLAGSLLLGEQVTWNQLIGGAVVIGGAAISQGRLDRLLAKLGWKRF